MKTCKSSKWASPRACQGIIQRLGLAWQSFHLPWATGSTNSHPKMHRAGASPVIPLQAKAHKPLGTTFKIQPSVSLSLRRQRGGTHGEQKSFISSAINYSPRCCPGSLWFSPRKVQGITKQQCLATFSFSESWGTGLRQKFDWIPLQLSSPASFCAVPPLIP